MAAPERIFPFCDGGAALGAPLPSGLVTLTDLTSRPRFGVKGSGSSAWLATRGVAVPAINRVTALGNMRVLRLGNEDIVLLAEQSGEELGRLIAAWHAETGPRGYEILARGGLGLDAPVGCRPCSDDGAALRY